MTSNHNNPWGDDSSPWSNKNNKKSGDMGDNITKLFKDRRPNLKMPQNNLNAIKIAIIVFLGIWGLSGFYQVEPNEQGVVLRLGEFIKTTPPGLHYHLPSPIEKVYKPSVTQENRIEIGFRANYKSPSDKPEESLMLTGDENIVDIHFAVTWDIKDAKDYLFNMRDPNGSVRVAAESAIREIIAQRNFQDVVTTDRKEIQDKIRLTLQNIMDDFGSGIRIKRLELLKVDPPRQVIDAFNEVQRAKADKERLKNEADAYANSIIPNARGDAQKLLQEAEAYKFKKVNEAKGESARFLDIYYEYKNAKFVTSKRLYFETLEEILGKTNKLILDPSNKGNNILPLLNLK